MKKYTTYIYWDELNNKYVKRTEPTPDVTCTVLHTLIADPDKYLYNTKTNSISNGITIPSISLTDWEERTYL